MWRRFSYPLCSCALLFACSPRLGGAVAPGDEVGPSTETLLLPVDPEQCRDEKAKLRPFVVDWDASDRTELSAYAQGSLAVVRVEGCEIELLPTCTLPGAYEFRETTPTRQEVTMSTATAIYANLPFAVAKIEGKLAKSDSLSLAYTLRGIQYATRPAVYEAELAPGCEGATHLILNYAAGAYSLEKLTGLEAGASAEVTGVGGAGVERKASKEALIGAGTIDACPAAADCSSPVRLRLVPILPGQAPAEQTDITQAPLEAGTSEHLLTRGELQIVIRSGFPWVEQCLTEAIARRGGDKAAVSGVLNTDFHISPKGTVISAKGTPEGSLDPEFVACVEDVVHSLRFPVSSRDLTVRYPFRINVGPDAPPNDPKVDTGGD